LVNYYRAIHNKNYNGCDTLKPKSIPHEKTKNGKLVYKIYDNEPFFAMSHKPVLCFSKTIVGALTGAVTGKKGFRGGKYHVCKTTSKPDIDLSKKHIGDFANIKEVRYNRSVKAKHIGSFDISSEVAKKVASLYRKKRPDLAVKLVNKSKGKKQR